jgi:NDP-sugar pyrophosphorylase family protein
MSAMPLPHLFAELPEPLAAVYDPAAPWALLGEPLDGLFAALPGERIESPIGPDVRLLGHRIVLARGVRIQPGAVLEGPLYVGPGVLIRTGAYLRGGVWLEEDAIVGANTEVKRAIFLRGARAPHLAYVGDSILGAGVNLGAGTVLSNFRHDGMEVEIPTDGGRIATGRRKLGAVLGDGVDTGCNSVLHPGCVVGSGTGIYPGVDLRSGLYPADSLIKLRQEIEIVRRRDR